MLRRSILELSRRRCVGRSPRQIRTQVPSYLTSRKEFSTASHPSNGPGSTGKPSEPKSNLSKFIIVNVVIGAAALTAYQAGYLDQLLGKKHHSSVDSKDAKHLGESVVLPNGDKPNRLSPDAEDAQQNMSTQADVTHIEALGEVKGDMPIQVEDKSDLTREETSIAIEEKELPEQHQNDVKSEEQTIDSGTLTERAFDMESADTTTSTEMNEEVHTTTISSQASAVPEANDTKTGPPQDLTTEDMPEDALGKDVKPPMPLLDAYDLIRDNNGPTTSSSGQGTNDDIHLSREEEASIGTGNDAYVSKDGKLVLDFLQAIHAAEKRQAELDAHVFGEEKRMLKEKYEKELKDARARQLMYAEEAAMLDKELNKERMKAAAAVKSLQEKADEKLRMELEQKENEAEVELKKIQELAKAELAAAIASEKASQIEKMTEANLNINALCMAFYARSEEARQTHSIHKLALGALAIEETLSKGLPVQREIEVLHNYLEGIDKDSLVDLVLSSLPDETRHYGTDTLLQLNQKFDALKGTLRHFSLIPPGGGGILAHSLAHIASSLKVKEVDQSGDGIESVINRVESYLAEGKLAEAADILEEGVRGSQAAEVVGDWVKRARNRAISEQALTLLRSYATSVSLT